MSADAELPVQQSFLDWFIGALGVYALLLPLVGLVCFAVTLIIVMRGRGSMAAAALLLVVHAPLFIGAFAALQGAIGAFNVIAMSDAAPKPADVAAGVSTALVAPMAGILLIAPSYATAAIGAFLRSMKTGVGGGQSKE